MTHIKINQEGAAATIEVDGVPLQGCVTAASVTLGVVRFPTVEVRLVATSAGLDLKDGQIKVGALDAPEALERALLAHLQAKYEPRTFVQLSVRETPVPMDYDGRPIASARPQTTPMDAVREVVKRHGGGSGG